MALVRGLLPSRVLTNVDLPALLGPTRPAVAAQDFQIEMADELAAVLFSADRQADVAGFQNKRHRFRPLPCPCSSRASGPRSGHALSAAPAVHAGGPDCVAPRADALMRPAGFFSNFLIQLGSRTASSASIASDQSSNSLNTPCRRRRVP